MWIVFLPTEGNTRGQKLPCAVAEVPVMVPIQLFVPHTEVMSHDRLTEALEKLVRCGVRGALAVHDDTGCSCSEPYLTGCNARIYRGK